MGSRCTLLRPGLVDYDDALERQRTLAERVRAGGDEALILLEHPPTYTLGVRGDANNILAPVQVIEQSGARIVRSDRGGDVTYHGPGQVVGYPILDLRRRGIGAVAYVRKLEQVVIETIGAFGIESERVHGRPGVWTSRGKIAAIGVRISGGVSTHGFALNVAPDLRRFEQIIACGLRDAGVTSMAEYPQTTANVERTMDELAARFAASFDVELVAESADAAAEVTVGR